MFKLQALADNKGNVAKMISPLDRVENFVAKKEKLLIISIFTFSLIVFNSLPLHIRNKSGLCSKMLTPYRKKHKREMDYLQ